MRKAFFRYPMVAKKIILSLDRIFLMNYARKHYMKNVINFLLASVSFVSAVMSDEHLYQLNLKSGENCLPY